MDSGVMWKFGRMVLWGCGIFGVQRGAEIRWPEVSATTWWYFSATAFLVIALVELWNKWPAIWKFYKRIIPISLAANPSKGAKEIGAKEIGAKEIGAKEIGAKEMEAILWTKIAKTHELVSKVRYWGETYKTSGHFPPSLDIGDAINDLRPYLVAMGTTDVPEKYLDEADLATWHKYLKTLIAQRPSSGARARPPVPRTPAA